MNRRIGIAVSVAIVVAAYPVAAWLIGLSAEHQWEQREQQIAARFPYFKIVKRDYRRGVYGATEEVTYRLTGPFTRQLQSLPGHPQEDDLQFTIRNTIHHGPLPQLRAFAPATVDSEVILPPRVQAKLAAVFDGKTHLTIHTTQHWLGSTTTVVRSTPFTRQLGGTLNATWRGLDAMSDFGRDLKYWRTDLTAPGLEVTSDQGNVKLESLRLRSDQRLAIDGLYVGSVDFTLAHLELAQPGAASKVSLQKVVVSGKSAARGDYIDFDTRFDADALQVKQFDLARLGLEFRGSHFYAPAMAALNKAFQDAQANSTNGKPDVAKMMEPLKTSGEDILVRDPVFEIPRIGFAMPEGELLICLKASAKGLTRSDLDGPPTALRGALVKHLLVSADVRIDTDLLDKLLDSSGQSERITGQLQGLQRQGYIKLEGKALTTHLAFEGGQLKVNGQSFPPMPAGAMPQAPPRGHP